jgi:transposase
MAAGADTDAPIKGAGEIARQRIRQSPRGNYSLWFKLQVIKETLVPGASVSVVARRHDINTNVVFRWRKEFQDGKYGNKAVLSKKGLAEAGFVEIGVADDAGAVRLLPAPQKPGGESVKVAVPSLTGDRLSGLIEIETADGVKLRIEGRVDDRTLRVVLAAIRRLA